MLHFAQIQKNVMMEQSNRWNVLTASLGWWKPGEPSSDENPSGAAA
jgi:hypothetical protein